MRYQKASVSVKNTKVFIEEQYFLYEISEHVECCYDMKGSDYKKSHHYKVDIVHLYTVSKYKQEISRFNVEFKNTKIGTLDLYVCHCKKIIKFAAKNDVMIEPEYRSKGIGSFAFNELISIAKMMPKDYMVTPLQLSVVDSTNTYQPENGKRRDNFYRCFGFDVKIDEKSTTCIEGHACSTVENLKNYTSNKMLAIEPDKVIRGGLQYKKRYLDTTRTLCKKLDRLTKNNETLTAKAERYLKICKVLALLLLTAVFILYNSLLH